MKMNSIEEITRGMIADIVEFSIDYYNDDTPRDLLYDWKLPTLLQSLTDRADRIIEEIRHPEQRISGSTLDEDDELYEEYNCIDDEEEQMTVGGITRIKR